jgi:hypothetical protein
MKCQDAIDSLRAAQDEFALRYYRWCLRESARELAAGFPRVRQFPSSQSLAFLDFVDTLTADEACAVMAGNLKFHHAASADLAGDVATTEELAMRQRWLAFLRPEIVRQGERCTTLYVSPREQSIMQRDLDGGTRLWEKTDRKTFIAVLQYDSIRCWDRRNAAMRLRSSIVFQSGAGTCTPRSTSAVGRSLRAHSMSRRAVREIFAGACSPAVTVSTCSGGAASIRRHIRASSKPASSRKCTISGWKRSACAA